MLYIWQKTVDPMPNEKSRSVNGREPAPDTGVAPYANDLNHAGHRARVLRVWQTSPLRRSGKKVQFMQFGGNDLRPVIWLHSLEYPTAPPWGLCVDAAAEGFGILAVRRCGFGESCPVANVDEEVAVLAEFLEDAGIERAVLVVEGTARPAGLKLAQTCPRISFTFLVRPAYSDAEPGGLDPWVINLVLQTLQTQAGASLSLAALHQIGRRGGYAAVYESLFKLPCDREFIQTHTRDLNEAWACFSRINTETFRRNLSVLINDPALSPGALEGFAGMALIGAETVPVWREAFEAKSAALGIATATLPRGSFFTLHQSSTAFLELLKSVA